MTFEELWQTLPIPFGYQTCTTREQNQWKALVEAAFKTGLFEGTYMSGKTQTADSKRIADLEAAVAEIRGALEMPNRIGAQPTDSRTKEMRSALKVIYTWCRYPDSFDVQHVKQACLLALGREE